MSVGQNLSYPNEKIISGSLEEIEKLKKNRNKNKTLKKSLPAVPTDGFSSNSR